MKIYIALFVLALLGGSYYAVWKWSQKNCEIKIITKTIYIQKKVNQIKVKSDEEIDSISDSAVRELMHSYCSDCK